MINNFEEYGNSIRQELDQAFSKTLSACLANISPINFSILDSALNRGKKVRGILLCLVIDILEGGELARRTPWDIISMKNHNKPSFGIRDRHTVSA